MAAKRRKAPEHSNDPPRVYPVAPAVPPYDMDKDPAGIAWLLKILRAEKREAAAWERIAVVLRDVSNEPLIAASRGAGFFACSIGAAAMAQASRGDDAWRNIDSHLNAKRALTRNSDARAWVRAEWVANSNVYKGNKTAFAADYGTTDRRSDEPRGFVWQRFNVRVSARTIRERWLDDR